jgi:hypothetical protein
VQAIAADTTVRWKSISGVGLALLLLYGALNVVSAIVVPVALEARAVKGLGDGAVLIGTAPEEYMLGTTYVRLHRDNPKLDKLLAPRGPSLTEEWAPGSTQPQPSAG